MFFFFVFFNVFVFVYLVFFGFLSEVLGFTLLSVLLLGTDQRVYGWLCVSWVFKRQVKKTKRFCKSLGLLKVLLFFSLSLTESPVCVFLLAAANPQER